MSTIDIDDYPVAYSLRDMFGQDVIVCTECATYLTHAEWIRLRTIRESDLTRGQLGVMYKCFECEGVIE